MEEALENKELKEEKKTLKQKFQDFSRRVDLWSRKKSLRRKIYLDRYLYLMMFPYVLLFFTFTVLPVLMSFILSFTDFNMLEFPRWMGWENYLNLFLEDPIFITAIKCFMVFFMPFKLVHMLIIIDNLNYFTNANLVINFNNFNYTNNIIINFILSLWVGR